MDLIKPPSPSLSINERVSLFISYFIVALILVCVSVPIVGFVERVTFDWEGGYLLPAVFIIAIEATISWRTARLILFPSSQWFYYRATEAVILLLGLKLYIYAIRGWDQLWLDLPRWQSNFFSFFTGEYLFAVLLGIAIWIVATRLANALGDLEGDDLLELDVADSHAQSDRAKARQRLLGDIFIMGSFMLVLTAILRQNLGFIGIAAPPLQTGLLNVVLYFLLGLIMLAQSQFAVLRARWIIDRMPIRTNMAGQWALYSAILVLVSALLVIFLPTRYSLGLLESIGVLITILNYGVALILFLLLLPIQFIASLFGMNQDGGAQQAPPEMDFDFGEAGGINIPFSETLKSILFWGIFALIIFGSIYYYVRQRADLFSRFPRINLPKFNFNFKFKLPTFRRPRPILSPFAYLNLRRLSARDRVRYYYRALLRRADVPRGPSDTPFEYRQTLSHLPPEEIDSLTDAFVEAQYTRHDITPSLVDTARTSWENLKKALRSFRRS